MMRLLGVLSILGAALMGSSAAWGEVAAARRIVAVYDSEQTPKPSVSSLHQIVQLPLNHLGLVVVFHDLRKGLPNEVAMVGARGVISWFTDSVPDLGLAYLEWLHRQMDAGRRVVILQHPGVLPGSGASPEMRRAFDRVMARLGVRWLGTHHKLTYKARVVFRDPAMMGFERPLPPLLPAFDAVEAVAPSAKVILSVKLNGARSDLIVVGPDGAYVSARYAVQLDDRLSPPLRFWHLNPFRFFRLAFATQGLPKPDITTISGRRLFYSHVDGDGWRNLARQTRYRRLDLTAAEVMYREIFKRYTDLPVTLAPVVADLDPKWYGSTRQIALARRIFRLPHVEAGVHTQSHPFRWAFFRNYRATREIPYLRRYPRRPGRTLAASVFAHPTDTPKTASRIAPRATRATYDRPRAYAVRPFDLKREISGSAAYLSRLLPVGKRVRLYQWSGDTSPFKAALAATARAGLRNINGGDGRMYRNYRSYAFVAPYGRWEGGLWQPYASQSNENIYTNFWKGRYFAYVYLMETFGNTGRPIRVMPVNVYYHLYLAERDQGLAALRLILDHVSSLEIAPVRASRFAAMSDGFVKTRLVRLGARRWRVENRGAIETIRFDYASADCLDFARSRGVTGQRHHQGSLYLSLDGAVKRPVIMLATCNAFAADPESNTSYLIHARWRIWALERLGPRRFGFRAAGFGPGRFQWRLPKRGKYRVRASTGGRVIYDKAVAVGADHRMFFTLPRSGAPVRVSVTEAGR